MRFQLLIILISLSLSTLGQEGFGETTVSQKHVFGINLIPSVNGDIYHFAEVEILGNNKYRYDWITRQEFIMKASGLMPSKANPEKEDFFKKFKINSDNPYWDPIHNLWRLRFEGYPLDPADNSGWFIPNPRYTIPDSLIYKNGAMVNGYLKTRRDSITRAYEKQRKLLAEFGIHKFSDYAIGDNAFKMIKAVDDKNWIENYINRSLPPIFKQALSGQKPAFNAATDEEARRQTKIHDPFDDITIRKVKRTALDQLLHGVKKKK